LGFAISAIVQAWVPRERVEAALSGSGPKPVALATGLGAASSSCSYAAIAIAKSLFQKGASAASALAFQFASTNLVWELGLVLWILLGWQFTLGEYLGGIVMIGLMWAMLRLFVSRRDEERAREHALHADAGHQHESAGGSRLTSFEAGPGLTQRVQADRFVAATPDRLPPASYDEIWSNPPIRVGKQALHVLLLTWLPRLAPGGRAVMVVGKNLGADSLASWLGEQGYPTTKLASAKGFRVLESRRG